MKATKATRAGTTHKPVKGGAPAKKKKVEAPGTRDVGFLGSGQQLDLRPVKELFPHAIGRADVADAKKAASVLAKLFGDPVLEADIEKLVAGLDKKQRAGFERSLGAFAVLSDTALTMLDYDKMTTGWGGWSEYGTKYPGSRSEYRARKYRHDLERTSIPRQDASRQTLGAALLAMLKSKDPAAQMDATLVQSFMSELGLGRETTADWKPTAQAVSAALDHELLIPLRALYSAAAHLDHGGVPLKGHSEKELNAMSRKAVETIAQHVVEGDFEAWRFNHAASQAQLAGLDADQLAAFRKPISVSKKTARGHKLTTRDEQGLGLPWVTKIGGPSHGFDMLSQCLLPLLSNARNGAIVVDEDGHPGAARSILRLLPRVDDTPVLYLEMLQVDYPYDDRARASSQEMRLAIVRHAIEKAAAIGIPLAISSSRWESAEDLAKEIGVKGQRTPLKIVLEPSGGVFESSDTLLGAHHAPQTKREIVNIPRDPNPMQLYSPYPFLIQP